MKTWNSVALSGGVIAMAVTTVFVMETRTEKEVRSVQPLVASMPAPSKPPSRVDATGLFVGVQKFPHDETLTVPYAVDDAVDLAYQFTLNPRSRLVSPRRAVLALSGSPQKEASQQRLRELRKAGAQVANATSGDILNLLRDQVAKAGDRGLFVLSIATHGILAGEGDAYILGSTSSFEDLQTALRLQSIIDIAGNAARSVLFIDACRNREGQTSRGMAPDPMTAAPMLRKLARYRGQAIFYAAAPGGYAFDDEAQQNGVFTKAALEGLDCKASAPRQDVTVETLHKFIDRQVQLWLEKNRKVPADPATQISMEGETRNMPLARCWVPPVKEIHIGFGDATITTYDSTTRPLWRKDLSQPIVHAEVADLDADSFQEVVVGTRGGIVVFDHEGGELWKTRNAAPLATFTTGDLFEKHTNQIVVVWEEATASHIAVLDSSGKQLSTYESPDKLQHVAVGRPTNMHAPKIAAASRTSVFLLNPKKLENGKPLWQQSLVFHGDSIRTLRIVDTNSDARRDIEVSTKNSKTVFAFDGTITREGAAWREVGKMKRKRSAAPRRR